MGGIATFCRDLLGSSLREEVDLMFVQTSTQRRELLTSGKASWRNLADGIKDCGRFFRACLAYRPAVAHISTSTGLSFLKNSLCALFARAAGSRVLLHPHCSLARLSNGPAVWRSYCAAIFRASNGVVALSKEWLALKTLVPRTPVYDLPNAIDTRPYRAIASRRPATGGGPVRMLYLGYLGEPKGTYDLLQAFSTMETGGREAVLELVGDFMSVPDKDSLAEAAKGFSGPGRSVRLLPPVEGEEKLAFFERADIFVFPSHFEGMPIAILEAMACGLPVVATAVGGIPDMIVDGRNGLLIPPRAPLELAAALGRMCRDAGLRWSCGLRNAAKSGDFDIDLYAGKLSRIYALTITPRPPKMPAGTKSES